MKVELLNVMGNDDMIVDVARVSYLKEASQYTEEENDKLLKYLYKHNHWSPFSHPQLQFRIEMPIYVERQLVKTEAGRVYNSISGRYVDFSDTYSLISEGEWRKQSKSSKQGSDGFLDEYDQKVATDIQNALVDVCKMAYDQLISIGVSKEQARSVLPLSLNTTQIWTGSLWTFFRLYEQRNKPDAQKETGDVVREMMKQVRDNGAFDRTIDIIFNK